MRRAVTLATLPGVCGKWPTRSAESRRSQRWLSMLRRERSRAPFIAVATIVLMVVLSVVAAAPVSAASMVVNPGNGLAGDPVTAVWGATPGAAGCAAGQVEFTFDGAAAGRLTVDTAKCF